MKYYIIAGEASGDLHGANLIKELQKKDHDARFRLWGGDKMAAVAGEPVRHINELAFMGFVEVLANIRTIISNLSFCKKDIQSFSPDAIILIDYPGFNLRIAKFAREKGIKVIYYISPQVWAWKQSRVKLIKKCVDKMLVILPFEKQFYANFDYCVDFVGHPLLDEVSLENTEANLQGFCKKNGLEDKPIVSILPGSRKQEISRMLKLMTKVIDDFADYQFVVAGVSSYSNDFYNKFINNDNVKIVFGQTYDLLKVSHAAMVTSGTATLETAMHEVPQVVCYKGGVISYLIAKNLVKVKYISLVNLIMDKLIVKELIQKKFNFNNLKNEIASLIYDNEYRTYIINEYQKLKELLGGPGASENAAEIVYNYLNSNVEN